MNKIVEMFVISICLKCLLLVFVFELFIDDVICIVFGEVILYLFNYMILFVFDFVGFGRGY